MIIGVKKINPTMNTKDIRELKEKLGESVKLWRPVFYKQPLTKEDIEDLIETDIIPLLSTALDKQRGEIEKAFGGCKECYGKGYATVKVQAGHRGKIWELDPIRPCDCDRGKQIRSLLSKLNQKQ